MAYVKCGTISTTDINVVGVSRREAGDGSGKVLK